jgi:hypothetical protein
LANSANEENAKEIADKQRRAVAHLSELWKEQLVEDEEVFRHNALVAEECQAKARKLVKRKALIFVFLFKPNFFFSFVVFLFYINENITKHCQEAIY